MNIDTEIHIGNLTKCNISRDQARKIMTMTVADLEKAIATFGAIANKSAMQAGLVDAARAELTLRQEA